jgi:hypothetical protein
MVTVLGSFTPVLSWVRFLIYTLAVISLARKSRIKLKVIFIIELQDANKKQI